MAFLLVIDQLLFGPKQVFLFTEKIHDNRYSAQASMVANGFQVIDPVADAQFMQVGTIPDNNAVGQAAIQNSLVDFPLKIRILLLVTIGLIGPNGVADHERNISR